MWQCYIANCCTRVLYFTLLQRRRQWQLLQLLLLQLLLVAVAAVMVTCSVCAVFCGVR